MSKTKIEWTDQMQKDMVRYGKQSGRRENRGFTDWNIRCRISRQNIIRPEMVYAVPRVAQEIRVSKGQKSRRWLGIFVPSVKKYCTARSVHSITWTRARPCFCPVSRRRQATSQKARQLPRGSRTNSQAGDFAMCRLRPSRGGTEA